MDKIAELLKVCGDIRLEIQGHTDSQGREEMNLVLSQSRAQSVLNELRARRVLTSSFSAKGYGESLPLQDNDTEEGREANRRIEFRLIRPEPSVQEGETMLETIAETGNKSQSESTPPSEGETDEQN
jgi:OOP family OmpA-OmpF porin